MRKSHLIPLIVLLSSTWPAVSAEVVSPQRSRMLALGCTGCHGLSGQGYGTIPAINRKSEAEFVRQMQEFRAQRRRATVMDRIAKGYSDEEVAALATYFNHR